jgi:hypothetical protein
MELGPYVKQCLKLRFGCSGILKKKKKKNDCPSNGSKWKIYSFPKKRVK